MRRAVSKRRDPEDGYRTGARPCPPANRNSGDTKKTNGKRAPDNRAGLREESAQTPIRATLIGSNRCEALGITARGYAPALDLCRALVNAGHDPRRPLHAYRGETLAIQICSIGEGARLTVREDRCGPRFVPWEPFLRRVRPKMREKEEGAPTAPDQNNEPRARPGAAFAIQTPAVPSSAPSRGKRSGEKGKRR